MSLPVSKLEQLVARDLQETRDGDHAGDLCVRVAAVAELPSRFGNFRLVAFCNPYDGQEHIAIVRGEIVGRDDVPTRLHSECLTGDALGSLRCDCRDQLQTAMRKLGQMERGLILYLRQEGRGIGLLNKIRAYELQDSGMDTVEANLALGFADDERDYAVAVQMIRSLEIRSIRLMTNNPRKIEQLERHGVRVSGRIRHEVPPNRHNRFYLETKAARSGHMIDLSG